MLSVCACRRSRWSPGLPSCLERVPSYLLFSSPSSSPTTTDWPTSRPAPPASPAAPPRLTLRTPALWPRPPVTRRTSSHSYRTAACDWQLARPITAQKLELCLLVPPPFRINGYQLLFLFFTFLQVQTVEWRGVAFGGDHTDELYSLWCSQVVCLTTDGCCVAFTCSLEGVTAWVGKSLFKLCCVHVHLVGISAFYLSERLNRLLTAVSCIWMTTKSKNNGSRCLRVVAPTWESIHVNQKLFQLFHSTWTHKWYISQDSRLICSVLFWFCDDRLSHIIIAI